MSLPKCEFDRRLDFEPGMRIFAYCPDCRQYLFPGVRSDMCIFCRADFSNTPEFMAETRRELELLVPALEREAPYSMFRTELEAKMVRYREILKRLGGAA